MAKSAASRKSTSPRGAAAARGSRSTMSTAGARPVSSTHRASFSVPGLGTVDGAKMADLLQQRLVSLIDLGLTLKHIHWNVVGPSFIGVHEMLDPQYEGVQKMVDETAERIATLGGVPSGLPGRVVEMRNWDDYDLGRADTQAHLGALDLVYAGVIEDQRDAIEAAGDVDPVTEDMLIGQAGVLEQYHWFVRTHLEDWAGGLANAGADTELAAAEAAVRRTRRPSASSTASPRKSGSKATARATTSRTRSRAS